MTREEQQSSGSTTAIIFVLCLVFVYLLLSAQYESYILPLVVILSIPAGLMGSFIFAQFMGVENNIYMQIALIMLIGLLAKNAILITEFALERRQSGMSIVSAAVLGASARLRPILMTSLAMVIGLLPLMFASGVGANGNSTLGTGAIGGMLIGMICQIFIVPALFVAFQILQERFKPMHGTTRTTPKSKLKSNNTRNNGDEKTSSYIYDMPGSAGKQLQHLQAIQPARRGHGRVVPRPGLGNRHAGIGYDQHGQPALARGIHAIPSSRP